MSEFQNMSEAINNPQNFFIGLGLAISSSVFIGASFVIKKKGLLRLNGNGQIRAGSGGHGYLKEWIWWAGFLSMGIGEAANFAAYAFAPASLVTPLGILSVLVSTVLSSKYLGEKLNLLGKIGCFLCVTGSTIIVLHAPRGATVNDMDTLAILLFEPGFIIYVVTILVISSILILFYVPRYGSSNVVIYIMICSVIGSLSVMECKGLGLALRETFSGQKNEFANWLTWFFLVSLIACVTVQINYLNKALDTFNTSVVTPVYYVFFTSFVIIASAILYQEWRNMSAEDIVGNFCGFLTVICAIFLLNAFRECDINLSNLSSLLQEKARKEGSVSNGHSSVSNNHSSIHDSASVLIDHHALRNDENSVLLERHSRQNSLESRSFNSVLNVSEGTYNTLLSFTGN